MTAHRHAADMALYASDAAETETPWERWEFLFRGTWIPLRGDPDWSYDAYRRKAEMWFVLNAHGKMVDFSYTREGAENFLVMYAPPGCRLARMVEVGVVE